MIKLAGIAIFVLFAAVYILPLADKEFIQNFSRLYADPILLAFLLLSIVVKLFRSTEKLEPLFWYLIGGAFLSWFGLTILRLTHWEQLSLANRSLFSNISYFLFYALMIAASEIKSFSNAKSFLNQRSFITSLSVLSFLIGAFTYLILVPSQSNLSALANHQNSFYFYILMDCYLIARWWHLSWQTKSNVRTSFFILGLASFSWLIADVLEYSTLSTSEQLTVWFDWIWYFPYFLFFIGIQYFSDENQQKKLSVSLSRYHVLNSPLFFLGLVSLLFLIENGFNAEFVGSSLKGVQILWLLTTLILAVFQAFELFNTHAQRKFELSEMKILNASFINQLEQSNRLLESQTNANQIILDTINNPIFTLDMSGKVLSNNLAADHLLGYGDAELVNSNFSNLIPVEEELHHFFDYQSYRQQLAKNDKGLELESVVLTKLGEKIAVHVTISQSNKKSRDKLIVSLADIRQQKDAEKQLHQLKDEFTANISHEFRTPLTIVDGVIGDLLAKSKTEYEQQQLKMAKRNNLRLIHMVDQLLELSRVASDSIPVSDLDASEWMELICQSYNTIAKDRDIDYGFSICERILIRGNKQAFENILYNVLSNAFKYTPKGGSINVLLEEEEKNYQLTIADTGIGISKQDQTKVFDRFHRAESRQHAIPGAGIGLSLVKDLVNSMGWEIHLESIPKKGSKFIIQIKKATSEVLTHNTEIKSNIAKQEIELLGSEIFDRGNKSVSHRSKYLVLIIEDNIDMQRHLENILGTHHQCLVASNGRQGLSLADEYLPDIIICDVMMPGMDGFEVLNTLKSQEVSTHIPVILLTAKSDHHSKIKGLSAQADDYLTKPFDAEELVLKIANLLKARKKLQVKYESQWQGFSKTQSDDNLDEVENTFLLELNQLFEQNYQDVNFSMNHLANELAMSERQLQRKVKALVDISPLELLKRFRLEKSKSVLKQDVQIGLVAQSCGFSSQTYFGRCFKEHFGITPKVYQQQQ